MKAYELLAKEENWTKGFLAKDKDENKVLPKDPTAICWSIPGAISKCYPGNTKEAISKVKEALGHFYIVEFNDNPKTTHKDVIDLLTKANV